MKHTASLLSAAAAALALSSSAQAGATCRAATGPNAPTVVELYTSEGCSSCPPADRWLSTLKGQPDVVALAFHVTYWDRLGWPDRYALPEATARQRSLAQAAGQSQVYTPQVLVDGQDWRAWGAASLKPPWPRKGAPVVTLERDGDVVTATVGGGGGRLAGYWAVLEDGHGSAVKAGENAGETLHHDAVVRQVHPVPAWPAADGLKAQLKVSRGEAAFPRRVVFVVTDEHGAKPVQALALGC
jgi:hypothetical protein